MSDIPKNYGEIFVIRHRHTNKPHRWISFYENNIISTDPINSQKAKCLWLKVIQSVVPTGQKLLFSRYCCCWYILLLLLLLWMWKWKANVYLSATRNTFIYIFFYSTKFLPFSSNFMEILGGGRVKWSKLAEYQNKYPRIWTCVFCYTFFFRSMRKRFVTP